MSRHARSSVLPTLVGLVALTLPVAAQGIVFDHFGTSLESWGSAVAGLGDLDGDGFTDYAWGGPRHDAGSIEDAGAVFVMSSFSQDPLFVLEGNAEDDLLGRVVERAGDVDGDGVPDLLAGGSLDDDAALAVYSGVDGSPILTWPGNTATGFGVDAGGGLDVNNDGVPDIIVSEPFIDIGFPNAGGARVYSGADGSELWFRAGTEATESMGSSSVALLGDLDGDGFSDFGAGTSLSDFGGSNNIGHALIWSGQTGAVIHDHHGEVSGDFMGSDMAALGDVDDDGFDDIILSAHGWGSSQQGRVFVYSGADLTELWHFDGGDNNVRMGSRVARMGDLDGDGLPEVIGAGPDTNGDQGRVEVRSGVDGTTLAVLPNDPFSFISGQFGEDIDGVGDGNGDGVPDLIVGVPGSQRVLVYSIECGEALAFGDGCPGTGGLLPTLEIDGCRTPGGDITVRLADGLGGSQAWLFVGLSPAASVLPSGCPLNVGDVLVTIPVPLAGNGELELPETLALDIPLASVYLQSFVIDGGAAPGYSASRGLELRIE